jgi:hypothetical protein
VASARVDIDGTRVVATIPVGQAPRKIAVQPAAPGAGARPDATVLHVDAEGLRLPPGVPGRVAGDDPPAPAEEPLEHAPQLHAPRAADRSGHRAGETTEIEVAVPASGRVAFLCKFHAPLGQRGERVAADAARPARQDLGAAAGRGSG